MFQLVSISPYYNGTAVSDLALEPLATVLGWSQIDDILCYIDSLASLIPADGDAHVHHFGVFSIPQQRRSLSSSPSAALTEPQTLPQSEEDDQVVWPGVVDPGASFSLPTESPADYTNPYYSEADAAWGLCRLHDNLDFCLDFSRPEELDASTVFSELAYSLPEYTVPSPPIGEDSHILEGAAIPTEGIGPEQTDKANETQIQRQSPILESPKALVVPAHEQLLMEHYRNRVVNLFCVIDNAKSPWKTIHLTRVLQCAGELSFGGSTTTIRNALRNALLAISAFCLSNDHRAGRRLEDARKWETIASRYRCDAIGLLKDAVQSHLHQEGRPKYKEFVATTLSMITINVGIYMNLDRTTHFVQSVIANLPQVMSGDTSTCGMHLDGAEQLISYMSARKTRFSNKARSLHRIYLYLRVIYESTAVRRHRTDSSRFSPSFGSRRTVGPRPVIAREHILLADDDNLSSPSITKRLAPRPATSTELSSYECIYGVPQSLLLLLKACIELIDEVDDERTKSGTLNIPEPLNRLCDDLESEILDWPLEDREPQSAATSNANIIYHQTRAFLNALIIYFSQSIRLLGFRYLRQYVQTVLESIEAIEEIKAETKIVAAPLFWPAFIAATEAFEPLQQERFRAWYDRVQVYGIASVRTGIRVVQEVWRSGPVNSQRQMQCSWRDIVERTGDCLMLT